MTSDFKNIAMQSEMATYMMITSLVSSFIKIPPLNEETSRYAE